MLLWYWFHILASPLCFFGRLEWVVVFVAAFRRVKIEQPTIIRLFEQILFRISLNNLCFNLLLLLLLLILFQKRVVAICFEIAFAEQTAR